MKTKLLTVLVLLFITSSSVNGQEKSSYDWEYQAFPDLPFVIEHIELDLHLMPENTLIQGAARFDILSRRPDVTQLVFNTSDLEIQEISNRGNELEFLVSGDSLFVELADTLKTGRRLELLIMWESSSIYGINKDITGNIWTSLNPKTHHHWIPIPDHPEIAATLQANITVPAEMEVVFNGKRVRDEIISTEEKNVQWTSSAPVSVSGMSLAIGNFEVETARAGIKNVSVYIPKNALMEEVHTGLLSKAVSELKTLENTFNFEFPYEALHVVILPDHHWEEVQAGAGIIYVYQNLGSLTTQLKRGIAAQWLGNYHRYLEVPDARYEFLRAAAISSNISELKNNDSLQSIQYWNTWSENLQQAPNEFMLNTIQGSWNGLIQRFEGVTGWDEYASYWYDLAGVHWKELPDFQPNQNSRKEENFYTVSYQYDELNNNLSLIFEAQNNPVETLIGIQSTAFGFMDTTQSEFSVTGQLDTVDIDLPQGIDYLILEPEDKQNVKLAEYKPSMFLIRQLNSSNPEFKKQAALQLRNNLDNPDLQLALHDALREEENPEVRAEMLNTLAMITQGASGTEQTFLQMLNSESLRIQLEGIKALANYPGNDQVINAIQNKLLRTEEDSVFNAGLKTFNEIAELNSRLTLINRLNQMDGKHQQTLDAIRSVAASDTTGQTLQTAGTYIEENAPFSIRKQALMVLLDFNNDTEFWSDVLPKLQEDRDPRIRFYSLEALRYLDEEQRKELISNRLREELDPRVVRELRTKK